jgi:hypothetical protein
LTDLTGRSTGTPSAWPNLASTEIGMKSFSGSNGICLKRLGLTVKVVSIENRIV